MPLHLEPVDVSVDLENVRSVLIVSCPVCPPVSLAIQKGTPFIDIFKSGIKTPAFEDHIQNIRESLERRGVRTGVFSMYAPVPTMCLWTRGQHKRLRRRAKDFEAVAGGAQRHRVPDHARNADDRNHQRICEVPVPLDPYARRDGSGG
jgi:hypothetical protein